MEGFDRIGPFGPRWFGIGQVLPVLHPNGLFLHPNKKISHCKYRQPDRVLFGFHFQIKMITG